VWRDPRLERAAPGVGGIPTGRYHSEHALNPPGPPTPLRSHPTCARPDVWITPPPIMARLGRNHIGRHAHRTQEWRQGRRRWAATPTTRGARARILTSAQYGRTAGTVPFIRSRTCRRTRHARDQRVPDQLRVLGGGVPPARAFQRSRHRDIGAPRRPSTHHPPLGAPISRHAHPIHAPRRSRARWSG
jgi:hypothetical protein